MPRTAPTQSRESALDIGIVVPVYQGEHTIERLVEEAVGLCNAARTPKGRLFRVTEIILVCDDAIDESPRILDALEKKFPQVRAHRLSRNFGQHGALLAGISRSRAEWLVTLDEDHQHSPLDIGNLVDCALDDGALLVYGEAPPPENHGWLREFFSRTVKRFFALITGDSSFRRFSSFRLMNGDIARSLATPGGSRFFLDVALTWLVGQPSYCRVTNGREHARKSGYSYRRLVRHFVTLLLTAGNRPLRLIFVMGLSAFVIAMGISLWAVTARLSGLVPAPGAGWTSLVVIVCFFSGLILVSLAFIAEYVGAVFETLIGKPRYFILSQAAGAHGGEAREAA